MYLSKVSVYINKEIWHRFKEKVIRRGGSMRALSKEVQGLVQDSMVEDAVVEGFGALGFEVKKFIISSEVQAVAPKVPTSCGEVLKEMRL